MSRRILFITRKWNGIGGMQRYSRDVWRAIEGRYGKDAVLCAPMTAISRAFFPFIALAKMSRSSLSDTHIHLGDAALAPMGAFVKMLFGGTVSATACGLDVIYGPYWYQWLMRLSLPRLDRVCAISEATAEVVRLRGVDDAKIVVVPCGVWETERTVDSFIGLSETPHLISVARLVPRKGIAWFVEHVLPRILEHLPTLRYTVIGDGPELSVIKAAAEKAGVSHAIAMQGAVNDSERDALLAQSHLFVMPNIIREGDMEGFGIACIEASQRGIPIAAARMEGMESAVRDGETGRFFEPGNAEACATTILSMMTTPLAREEVAEATERHYGWNTLFDRYHEHVFGL